MIRKILIDLDQTILNHEKGINIALRFLYSKCKVNYEYDLFIKKYKNLNHTLWKMYEEGIIGVSTLISLRSIFIKKEFMISNNELNKFNKIYIKECNLFPIWLKIFPYLKKKKIDIYIFSNGLSNIQLKKIRSTRIQDMFSGFFFGEKYPLNKPNIFFLDKIYSSYYNIKKSEILVIGDSLKNDIYPAKRYGFQALNFDHNENEYIFIKKLIRLISYDYTKKC